MPLACRRVLARDAADQPGRLGGVVSAVGAQPAAPGQRQPGREGDPQLRAGGLDGAAVERVVFALVARRACEPGSKLAATGWVAQRVAIADCPGFTDDAAYAAMDFLLDALGEIAAEVFGAVAHLLNLDLDIVFVDTTSTYWETETADELAELADEPGDDQTANPVEADTRAFGHSTDHRGDLPQVVIAMAVTRDGVPVMGCRCGAGPFPGTPPTPRSSARSTTTWTGGGCAGWCGWPTQLTSQGSPPRPTGPT
jgi:hypothetical protein